MGASNRDFTEEREQNMIKVTMTEDYYRALPPYVRENMELDYVRVSNPEFQKDPKWKEAKRTIAKAYSALNIIEQQIEHK